MNRAFIASFSNPNIVTIPTRNIKTSETTWAKYFVKCQIKQITNPSKH